MTDVRKFDVIGIRLAPLEHCLFKNRNNSRFAPRIGGVLIKPDLRLVPLLNLQKAAKMPSKPGVLWIATPGESVEADRETFAGITIKGVDAGPQLSCGLTFASRLARSRC